MFLQTFITVKSGFEGFEIILFFLFIIDTSRDVLFLFQLYVSLCKFINAKLFKSSNENSRRISLLLLYL